MASKSETSSPQLTAYDSNLSLTPSEMVVAEFFRNGFNEPYKSQTALEAFIESFLTPECPASSLGKALTELTSAAPYDYFARLSPMAEASSDCTARASSTTWSAATALYSDPEGQLESSASCSVQSTRSLRSEEGNVTDARSQVRKLAEMAPHYIPNLRQRPSHSLLIHADHGTIPPPARVRRSGQYNQRSLPPSNVHKPPLLLISRNPTPVPMPAMPSLPASPAAWKSVHGPMSTPALQRSAPYDTLLLDCTRDTEFSLRGGFSRPYQELRRPSLVGDSTVWQTAGNWASQNPADDFDAGELPALPLRHCGEKMKRLLHRLTKRL